jgi:hypothetical protein
VATKQEMEEINYNFYNMFCKLNWRKPTKGWGVEVQGFSFFAKKNHCKNEFNLTNPISLNELQMVATSMAKGKSQYVNKVLVKFYTWTLWRDPGVPNKPILEWEINYYFWVWVLLGAHSAAALANHQWWVKRNAMKHWTVTCIAWLGITTMTIGEVNR